MNRRRAKRQHYIPRFYLEHFADTNGMIWTYDKERDEVRPATAENTAVESNFYSVKDDEDKFLDQLDEWLQGVERKAAPLHLRLLQGDVLEGQDKADYAVFLSSLYARTPTNINAAAEFKGKMVQHMTDVVFRDRDTFNRQMDRYDADTGSTTTAAERDAVFDFARDKSRYVVEVDRKAGLHALGITDRLTPLFMQMHWSVIQCEEQHLITSDNPVVRLTPRADYHPVYGDGGFLNKRTYVTVPLSPLMLLELHWIQLAPPGRILKADRERARLYNRQRAHFSNRYLYASRHDSGIRALARKHRGSGPRLTVSGEENMAPVKVRRGLFK